MAKKKSSSSKITITKATTVKTPTIKSYTPSKAVNAAKSTLQKTEKARPAAYTSKYGTQITGLADAIANRKGFSYDYTKDALYQNYKDQYQRQAQLGMQNATAQAAALSGGYGNSYAATAGNLAYQENMSALNNIIPSLYEAAYNRYQTDLDNQRSDLSMYQGLDESDYAKYRDRLAIGRMTETIMRIDMMRHIITILTTILRMYLISSGSMNSKMATASGDSSRTHPITGRIRITSYQKKLRPLLHPLVNEVRRAKGHLQPVGLRFQRILSRRLRNWLRTMTRRVSQNI